MKNILIPSTFEEDTLYAVKTAINHAKGKKCIITLMYLSEQPDSYSASGFLRNMNIRLDEAQAQVIDECRLLTDAEGNCRLNIHHQYGITGPLLKNLLAHFNTGLIILLPSFKSIPSNVHKQCVKLLGNCKNSILHLSPEKEQAEFTKALYLENTQTQFNVSELQQVVNREFNLKIVSQAMVNNELNAENLGSLLNETIEKNNIDLLIETRKPEKKFRKKKNADVNEVLGLPVLSIYENIEA